MFTIRPKPRCVIPSITCFVTLKTLSRFVASTASHSNLVELSERRVTGDAGTVDEDVDRTELGHGADHCVRARLEIRDVSGNEHDVAPFPRESRLPASSVVAVGRERDVERRDPATLLHQSLAYRAPKLSDSTGHQRDLVGHPDSPVSRL